MRIRKFQSLNVACAKWEACGWTGTRKVKRQRKALAKPCPRCRGPVVPVFDGPARPDPAE